MTNAEGVLINHEARMRNDEGMTKSEAQSPVAEPASTQALMEVSEPI